jgi:uncharacterized protein
MPLSGDFPTNLAAFCRVLRTDHGFLAGPRELQDAARALTIVGLSDERAVRDALRAILVSRPEELRVFDRLFAEFFLFPPSDGVTQPDQPPLDTTSAAIPRSVIRTTTTPQRDEHEHDAAVDSDEGDTRANADRFAVGRAYSADAGSPRIDRVAVEHDPSWDAAAKAFVRRLRVGLSRRWRPGPRGRRFDPRRTLRRSLQTGGEVLTPRWLHRVRRAVRLVVVIDGSRSMERHARTALEMAVGFAAATPRLEVFTFSTGLGRVTRSVRGAAAGARLIVASSDAWGGGTRIGTSLLRVLGRLERRPGARDTVLLIVSDGLDVGEPQVLQQAMAGLARRAAAVIWLNPLMESAGYQPIAEGMRIARPFISTLSSVSRPPDLLRLGHMVRLRS